MGKSRYRKIWLQGDLGNPTILICLELYKYVGDIIWNVGQFFGLQSYKHKWVNSEQKFKFHCVQAFALKYQNLKFAVSWTGNIKVQMYSKLWCMYNNIENIFLENTYWLNN